MKVLHVITDLGQGGAEAVLYRLIAAMPSNVDHCVISLRSEAYYGPRLRALGIPVHALEMPRGRPTLSGYRTLCQRIAEESPDVVQTWMYHADLLGGLAARWAGVPVIIWGVHHAQLDIRRNSLRTRLIAQVCAALSGRVPTGIVCCSRRAADTHRDLGYDAARITVIANGYDLSVFNIDPLARSQQRQALGIGDDTPLLGMVARWHPDKDHDTLLAALAQLKAEGMLFGCLLIGSGMTTDNTVLVERINQHGVSDRVQLLGPRDDIPTIMNALDVHVLSSASEAFPNTVAEAMACGTLCVVTDVGDADWIVGETGCVTLPGDAKALADGIKSALNRLASQRRTVCSTACRRRIQTEFSMAGMVEAYLRLWQRTPSCEPPSRTIHP